jgi:hypothetical protein
MSQVEITSTAVTTTAAVPSSGLRSTVAFKSFPWLNGITLVDGSMEQHFAGLGMSDSLGSKEYMILKVSSIMIYIDFTRN